MNDQSDSNMGLHVLEDALRGQAASDPGCEDVTAELSLYVEAELAGVDVAHRYPAVWRHLLACEECGAIYVEMIELEQMEASALVSTQPVPPPNLALFRQLALRRVLPQMAQTIAVRILPSALDQLSMAAEVFFERLSTLSSGVQYRPVPLASLGFGPEATDELRLLAATYNTLQAAGEAFDPAELLHRQVEGSLEDSLKRLARRSARDAGFRSGVAKHFAETFASVAAERVDDLRALVEQNA